jgi:streptogramin lyase
MKSRIKITSIVLTLFLFALFGAVAAGAVTTSEFPLPTVGSQPWGITASPDGNFWFTEYEGNKIGQITPDGVITEYTIPTAGSYPWDITTGPDGNRWFTENNGNKIGRITPGGVITEFPTPTANSQPVGITAGPDGNLWFIENSVSKIGRITPGGVITEFPTPTACNPFFITAGPDGNLWFTENGGNKIGRITTGGVITEFPTLTLGNPFAITVGPDGNLWFTEEGGNKIGRITPSGVVTEFSVPTAGSSPFAITAGPDGNLWFTEFAGNKLGRITLNGDITEFPTLGNPFGISAGLDGNLWFVESSGDKIGRITPSYHIEEFPTGSGSSPADITSGPDGNMWFTEWQSNKIGQLTPEGFIGNEYPIPTAGSRPQYITTGPDGNLWFTERTGNKIGRLLTGNTSCVSAGLPYTCCTGVATGTCTGVITEYGIPTVSSAPSGITAGPDVLYFTEYDGNKIGKISAISGAIAEVDIPTPNSAPVDITTTPDGNLWFVEAAGNKIGRLTPGVGITEYPIPTAGSAPAGITTGPDGNLWFTEYYSGKIGRITPGGVITEYGIPTAGSQPSGIKAGPGGLWFTDVSGNKIGRITTGGIITEYSMPTAGSGPARIATGPDGNLWFTEAFVDQIGRLPLGAVITEFLVPTANSHPSGITGGPDGNTWFTEGDGNKIGRITPAGIISEFSLPVGGGADPGGITTGPDGNLWFTLLVNSQIGRITTAGVITLADEFSVPTPNSSPVHITAGLDGNLWFTERDGGNIGRITAAFPNTITEFPVPTADSQPTGITIGPDGNIWFTEWLGVKIGRIVPTPPYNISEFDIPTSGGGAQNITAGPNGNLWFTESWIGANKIGSITTAPPNAINEFLVPTFNSDPEGITTGPDGNIWFTENNGNRLSRSTTTGIITEFPLPTTASGPFGITTGPDGNLWFTENVGNNIGRVSFPPCTYDIDPISRSVTSSAGFDGVYLITASGCSWTAASNDSWITITSGGNGSGNGTVSFSFSANPSLNPRTGTITIGSQTFTLTQDGSGGPVCTYSLNPASPSSPDASGSAGSVDVTVAAGCAWTAVSNDPWIIIYSGASGSGNGAVNYLVLPNIDAARIGTMTIAGQTFEVDQGNGCTYSMYPLLDVSPPGGDSGTITVTAGNGCGWTVTPSDPWITVNPGLGVGGGTVNYAVQANAGPPRNGQVNLKDSTNTQTLQTFAVTQESSNLTASVALPVGSGSAAPGGPLWVTATFTNNTTEAIETVRPDCFNTYFTVTDPSNNVLSPMCRLRVPYSIPGDLVTIAAGGSYTVTCDLSEMYDPSVLTSNPDGSAKPYQFTAAYVNFIQDPDLICSNYPADPACCKNEDYGCYPMFKGIISSNNQGTITITGPQSQTVQKLPAEIVFDPQQWDVAWAASGGPAITAQISSPDGSFDVNNINPSSVKLNGTVPIRSGSNTIQNGVLTVQFDASAVVGSLGTAVPVSIAISAVQGSLSTPANSIVYGQGAANMVNNTGTLIVQADVHVVGPGVQPAVNKNPNAGMETRVFDTTCVSGIAGTSGMSWQNYQTIWNSCQAVATDVTNVYGQATFVLPPGNYVVIGKYMNPEIYVGVSVGSITAGGMVQKYLQIIQNAQGKTVPAKYTKLTGSELLIIEPEYVEWDSTTEPYPFVFESVGDWGVVTSVSPPEGFVADYNSLSAEVDTTLTSLQFTITDVGSKWVSTGVHHRIKHKGRMYDIDSKIGVKLAPGLAKAKGLSEYGQEPPRGKDK